MSNCRSSYLAVSIFICVYICCSFSDLSSDAGECHPGLALIHMDLLVCRVLSRVGLSGVSYRFFFLFAFQVCRISLYIRSHGNSITEARRNQ